MIPPRSDPTAELLAASARGDHAAFARLYRLTAPHLYALARRILNNDDWAQECVQDAFVSLWRHAREYLPEKGRPITWMASIVRHRALDRLRTAHREGSAEDLLEMELLADPNPTPPERVLRSQEAQALRGCLSELKEEQRRIVLLAYFEGLTHEQLALRLNTPLGTVKTWLRRGLQQIKRCLER